MSSEKKPSILLIGFGNPAREDDALGPGFIEKVEKLEIDGVSVDSDYQLTVEDAAAVAEHDIVVFVDASIEGEGAFSFSKLEPKTEISFSSHSVDPAVVIGLARDLFKWDRDAFMLGIRGYSFAMFTEKMTEQAEKNMEAALDFLVPQLKSGLFSEV